MLEQGIILVLNSRPIYHVGYPFSHDTSTRLMMVVLAVPEGQKKSFSRSYPAWEPYVGHPWARVFETLVD